MPQNSEKLLQQIKLLESELKKVKSCKRYWLVWEDKPEIFEERARNALPILREDESLRIEDDEGKPQNIIIEWDNYHSLSALSYTHKGKIDVIYIDPPYNTWNKDFIYNDSFVDKEDSYRHSKWLSFMSKRLKLAKDLLADDGVIFISIDDNEFSQLKLLCDEIFWEQNFLENFHIQVRYWNKALNEKDNFQKLMEYSLIYAKNKYLFSPNKPHDDYDLSKFCFTIEEKWTGKEVMMWSKKVTIFQKWDYKITNMKEWNIDYLKATWASWSVLKWNTSWKFFNDYLEERKAVDWIGILYKVEWIWADGIGYRYFTWPKKENTTKWIFYSGIPLVRRKEITEWWGSIKYRPIINFYDYSWDFWNIRHEWWIPFNSWKKPVKFLKNLINIHKDKNITILDFFAGSWSTGHAVMDLNKEDWWKRRFILSTNNDNNICREITYSRVANVIKWYWNTKWLGGNLRYYTTEFIKADKSIDDLRYSFIDMCDDLLCIKENTFTEVTLKNAVPELRLFKKWDKYTAILYDIHYFTNLVKLLEVLYWKISVYIFSLSKDIFEEELEHLNKDITVQNIPDDILQTYQKIFNF